MRGIRRTLVITTLALSLGLMGFEAKAFDVVFTKDNAVRWHQNEIAFKISQEVIENTENQFGPNPAEAIRASFQSWNDVNSSDLTIIDGGVTEVNSAGKDNVNAVLAESEDWQYGQGVIAITVTTFKTDSGRTIDADIILNNVDYDWTTVDPSDNDTLDGKVDVQNIVTHEIGHWMGLEHSSKDPFESMTIYRLAAMFFSSFPGDIAHRLLNEDDEAAKRFLYPNGDVPKPTIDDFSPTLTSNVEDSVHVEINGSGFMDQTLVRFYNSDAKVSLVAKVLVNESERLEVVANFVGQPTGDWDVVVENAYNSSSRLRGALRVNGLQTSVAKPTSGGGGCGAVHAPHQSLASALVALITVIILTLRRRRELAAIKIKSDKRR